MASPVTVSRIQNRRGTQSQFEALYPPGYTGIGPVDINLWPNILLPGELALATDTRRVFLGNLNGEYVEISSGTETIQLLLLPILLTLPPSVGFTHIPALDYAATPFFTLLYDITNSPSFDWNTVGTTFSRNGEMKITATIDTGPGSVSLTDTSTDVNTTLFDISFSAEYNGANIEISYSHNFSGTLTFSSNTIRWVSF